MFSIHDMILLAEAYAAGCAVEEKTVSNRVFADSKKLAAMRAGGDITVGRFNSAMQWFSDNWPDTIDWPAGILRPPRSTEMEAAE